MEGSSACCPSDFFACGSGGTIGCNGLWDKAPSRRAYFLLVFLLNTPAPTTRTRTTATYRTVFIGSFCWKHGAIGEVRYNAANLHQVQLRLACIAMSPGKSFPIHRQLAGSEISGIAISRDDSNHHPNRPRLMPVQSEALVDTVVRQQATSDGLPSQILDGMSTCGAGVDADSTRLAGELSGTQVFLARSNEAQMRTRMSV